MISGPEPGNVEPRGMKAPFTSDGSGEPVPLTEEEAAEMRRESDAWDARLAEFLTKEESYLNERFLEVLATGATTMLSSGGTWTATLQRPRWRDGWLISDGIRSDGSRCFGRTRISRRSKGDHLRRSITLQLGIGMLTLRDIAP